jgi:uncharacterized 2Fe-2S/4Fe-4S cluster protein (DUF4445 family)
MTKCEVCFDSHPEPIEVPVGTLLTEVAREGGVEIQQPCGGQGRCGRCAVRVESGQVRRRSVLRLSQADLDAGYALACQTVVEGDAAIEVPPPEAIQRRLTTDHTAPEAVLPEDYDPARSQSIRRVAVRLSPPSMQDQTDDWSRLCTALRKEAGVERLDASLEQIRQLGPMLRASDWRVALTVETGKRGGAQLIRLQPEDEAADAPLCGLAIDIGTTTVTVWLVDLLTGRVMREASEYNQQIARGEDVISRIIYAGKAEGTSKLREMVLGTINGLIEAICQRTGVAPADIAKATVAGNSTMIHLFLGLAPESIRLEPFITTINHLPPLPAADVGIAMNPAGIVDPLPGVASYVGADITAGVLSSGVRASPAVTLFIDVGTNGETVLGSSEWLVTCACSAGPAFEGAGVVHGMRADTGAIEEVWIDGNTYEPSCRVIGNVPARGICGSGLISLVAEMFLTGLFDKGGNFNQTLGTPRMREGPHGAEYVVAWAAECEGEEDIVITQVDLENLLRAKAAVYAGFNVLADSVGVPLDTVEQVLIGGSFGKYINVEKAVDIGLLPDMPWERFHFLGNTSVKGAYWTLIDRAARDEITEIASAMTYIELSADNSFYEAFTSALFLPHTDLSRFPSVKAAMT